MKTPGKVIDLEDEKQKVKDRAKDAPPSTWLQGKGGIRVLPRWERGPDGEWRIMNLEAVKAMLGYDKED
jgi:hypothetical protein